MTHPSTTYARPALWGFFICMALAAVLLIIRLLVPSYISNRWETERSEDRIFVENGIHEAFQSKTGQLTNLLNSIIQDTSFAALITHNELSSTRTAFQALTAIPLYENQTIDLIDSQGNVVAWNGPSIGVVYTHVMDRPSPEPLVSITQNGLRTYITVGKRIDFIRMALFVSEPLEVNSPISNRFIQNISFCEELSRKLKTQIVLKLPGTYKAHGWEYAVPITDASNTTIAEFYVSESTLEGKISSTVDALMNTIMALIALGCLALLCAGVFWIGKYQPRTLTTSALLLSIWIVRILWRELNFPANWIGGWLFNPNLYASPFFFGLSSSLGELLLTVLTVAVSVWIFYSRIILKSTMRKTFVRMNDNAWRVFSFGAVIVTSLLVQWLFRGYGEALRSFVFDSTIRYNNPSELLPQGPAALMYGIFILLGISLISLAAALFFLGREFLFRTLPRSEALCRVLFVSTILICIPVFVFLDQTPFVPLLLSTIFLGLSITIVEFIVFWKNAGVDPVVWKWRVALWMVVGSFVLGALLFQYHAGQKGQKEVETVGTEFLRPSDSWLMYTVQDGLRTSVESLTDQASSSTLMAAKENNLAFVLWTRSLVGKEGYNSALILYDDKGNELDRFVVGMNKPEQQSILTKVFAGEEESVQIIDREEPKLFGKLYGAWTTVRDTSGQLIGSIALLLAEHKQAIFHEEDTEPLRQFGERLENDVVREIAFHIYKNDTLVFSTARKLYPSHILSGSVDSEFQNTANPFLWKDLLINGHRTQTVFMRDSASPERIAAISLENLDFRWDMLGYLKEFLVCIVFLVGIAFCSYLQNRKSEITPSLSFRAKLLIGFACITLVPLILLSTYNRQLVAEKVQKQGEGELYNELNKLQDRLTTYVSDEEDFVKGIDDDFCEALAAEYGTDFSVYRGTAIQASSRSELFRSSILDGRLNAKIYASIVYDARTQVLANEKIGSVEYIVGYSPIMLNGKMVGILAIPTLNRQREVEAELSEQNAYVFGMYAVIFGIALAAGSLLSSRFAQPIQLLTRAAKHIAEGNLEVTVPVPSHDEIGTLARSFNEMTEKLRRSREELAKHEREIAWKEMAKQVAHEIKNPLTPIKLSIQHVQQAFKDQATDREEILQRVSRTVIEQIDTLSRIATEFSHFAQLPERKFERVQIDELLRNTIDLFHEVEGITFVDQLSAPSVMIVADSDQLRGVCINIIRNAIQAIEKTGTITVSSSKEGRMCHIIISDTGPGIPEEIRSKIFEPNFSTKSEGMGIGLSIARRVIEDHGGIITCQSERGKGTTFEIRLPT